MADVAAAYTLVTPAGTVVFNDGATDEFYITDIQGLDGPPIRAPIDPRPQTDGAIVHDAFFGGLFPIVDGVLLIRSVTQQNDILTVRNQMEATLRAALNSILRADGTLSWTPFGGSAASVTVRYTTPLEFRYADNYILKSFSFGLVAADPSY